MKMSNTNFSTSQNNHHSIPEKVYKILAWLTNDRSKRSLVLYGPMASGKTVAFWEAIEQIKNWTPEQRPIPKEVSMVQEGFTNVVFKLSEEYQQYYYFQHQDHTHNNILEAKTVILVTTYHLPQGMADLLWADTLKFEHE